MAMSHNNLGLLSLKELGRVDDSPRTSSERLYRSFPTTPRPIVTSGNILQDLGHLDEVDRAPSARHLQSCRVMPVLTATWVARCTRKASAPRPSSTTGRPSLSTPDLAVAHFNLGVAVDESGDPRGGHRTLRACARGRRRATPRHITTSEMRSMSSDAGTRPFRAFRTRSRHQSGIRGSLARNLARLDPARLQASELEELLASGSLAGRQTASSATSHSGSSTTSRRTMTGRSRTSSGPMSSGVRLSTTMLPTGQPMSIG